MKLHFADSLIFAKRGSEVRYSRVWPTCYTMTYRHTDTVWTAIVFWRLANEEQSNKLTFQFFVSKKNYNICRIISTEKNNVLYYTLQETELRRIESLLSLENASAYVAYNATMRNLKRCCAGYLHSQLNFATVCQGDNAEDVQSCLTTLDRHRLNLCRREVERILERVKINGELADNRFIRIAMAHAYDHLRTFKELCEDVSIPKKIFILHSGKWSFS